MQNLGVLNGGGKRIKGLEVVFHIGVIGADLFGVFGVIPQCRISHLMLKFSESVARLDHF